MKNKKLINEEIKRIHEIMGIDTIFSNLLNESGGVGLLTKFLKPSAKLSDGLEIAKGIKNSSILDASGTRLLLADEIPHATSLVKLGEANNWVGFRDELIDMSKESAGSSKKVVADKVIDGLVNKVNNQIPELKSYKDDISDFKSNKTSDGEDVDKVSEAMQEVIYEDFYGENKMVEFTNENLRDIYVHDLKTKLDLDTNWKKSTDIEPTPSDDILTDIEAAKNMEIDARFEQYKKLAKQLEKTDKDFKMPQFLKDDTFRTELRDSIRKQVDSAWASRSEADNAKFEEWKQQLDNLTPAQKEVAIKEATGRAERALKSISEKILNWIKRQGYNMSVGTIKSIIDLPKNAVEFVKLIKQGKFAEAKTMIKNAFYRIIALLVMDIFNEWIAYTLRKEYDEDLPLPTYMVGIPDITSQNGFLSWLGRAIISKPILYYDMVATVVNGTTMIRHSRDSEGNTYLEEYNKSLEDAKEKGILPSSQFNSADANSAITLKTFVEKVIPQEQQKIFVDLITGGTLNNSFSQNDNFWGDALDYINDYDFNWDTLVGLPLNNFYFIGKDVFYYNRNGRFNVKGMDTDEPYIVGKYNKEGEEEKIVIKDLFYKEGDDAINRFLRDFYPTDAQTVLVEKTVDYPKIIFNQQGFDNQSEMDKAVGIVEALDPLVQYSLVNSGFEGIDMDDFKNYKFYLSNDVEQDPNNGFWKAKPNAKEIKDAPYYIDKKGTKDSDGNYPVYRITKTDDKLISNVWEPNTWYVRIPKDGKTWQPLGDFLKVNSAKDSQTTNESKTPKEQFETENPGIKLTLKASIGDLAVYEGDNNKRYKLSEGKIVEF